MMPPTPLMQSFIEFGAVGVVCAVLIWYVTTERSDRKSERQEHRADRESLVGSLGEVSDRYHDQSQKTATVMTELSTLLNERLPKAG